MINLDGLQQSILLVVIERDNFDRMKKADPITLESTQAGGLLPPPSYPLNLSLLIAYEEDQDDLYRRAKKNAAEMLKWLERGRVFIKGVDGNRKRFASREIKSHVEGATGPERFAIALLTMGHALNARML